MLVVNILFIIYDNHNGYVILSFKRHLHFNSMIWQCGSLIEETTLKKYKTMQQYFLFISSILDYYYKPSWKMLPLMNKHPKNIYIHGKILVHEWQLQCS